MTGTNRWINSNVFQREDGTIVFRAGTLRPDPEEEEKYNAKLRKAQAMMKLIEIPAPDNQRSDDDE